MNDFIFILFIYNHRNISLSRSCQHIVFKLCGERVVTFFTSHVQRRCTDGVCVHGCGEGWLWWNSFMVARIVWYSICCFFSSGSSVPGQYEWLFLQAYVVQWLMFCISELKHAPAGLDLSWIFMNCTIFCPLTELVFNCDPQSLLQSHIATATATTPYFNLAVFQADFEVTMSSAHEYQGHLGESQFKCFLHLVASCSYNNIVVPCIGE